MNLNTAPEIITMFVGESTVDYARIDKLDELCAKLAEIEEKNITLQKMLAWNNVIGLQNRVKELEAEVAAFTWGAWAYESLDRLVAGVNSFLNEYGVEVLVHSKKDCYGGYFQ